MFVGSPQAGHRAAILMSLIASCKSCEVEPWAWLRAVLAELPRGIDLIELLPDVWLNRNPKHRWAIAARRRDERQKKDYL